MKRKYRALVWIVLVPGKSVSAIVSRMVPIPNSSSVPGSFSAETSSKTDRRSCSLLSNQLRVDTDKIVTHSYEHGLASFQAHPRNVRYRVPVLSERSEYMVAVQGLEGTMFVA